MLNVAFTGIDHVALDACKAKDVMVCNAAGYSTQCVAELALGLAVGCLRFMPTCDQVVRNGGTSMGLRGREIGGKTVGIVGTGAIGTMTAKLFQAFGAKVIAYSRTVRPEVQAMGVEYVSLEEVMERSDIVSIHTPNNAETKGLISKELIGKMKPTAIFLNTARGAIVDNAALAEALNEGKIAAAGIDVFDKEPPLDLSEPLLNCKNCLVTPHVASATKESMSLRAEIVFDNLAAFLAGEQKNVIL
jgi:D-3-phosphoglycerate dehydrogenase